MHDPGSMGSWERTGDLRSNFEHFAEFHQRPPHSFAEREAVYKLHGDEVCASVRANFIDVCDVRVIERGGGGRFLIKAPQALLIGRHRGRKDFQSYLAMQACVFRQIHIAHATRADLWADFVATEPRIRGEGAYA